MGVWHGSFACVVAQGPRIIYTCLGWEREKTTSVLLASCVNAMAELVGLVGNSGWKERCKEKVTGKRGERGDAHELLTSPGE